MGIIQKCLEWEKERRKERGREGIREEGIYFDSFPTCWIAHRIKEGEHCYRVVVWEMTDILSRENDKLLVQNFSYGYIIKFEHAFVPQLEMPLYENWANLVLPPATLWEGSAYLCKVRSIIIFFTLVGQRNLRQRNE